MLKTVIKKSKLFIKKKKKKKSSTVSNLELGRAPVNEATKILVMMAPRGTITESRMAI